MPPFWFLLHMLSRLSRDKAHVCIQILLVKLVFFVSAWILFNLRFPMEKEEQLPPTMKKRLSLSVSKRKDRDRSVGIVGFKKPRFESRLSKWNESASKKFVPKTRGYRLSIIIPNGQYQVFVVDPRCWKLVSWQLLMDSGSAYGILVLWLLTIPRCRYGEPKKWRNRN